jgi:hypothetical protein
MINHDFSLFYDCLEQPSNQIHVPLTAVIGPADRMRAAYRSCRGHTRESAEDFAVQALKIIQGSTYRSRLNVYYPRVSYDVQLLTVSISNSVDFITDLTHIPSADMNYLLDASTDLRETYRSSAISQEIAAAILVGYLTRMQERYQRPSA